MKNLILKIISVLFFLISYQATLVYSQDNYIIAGYHDDTMTYFDINPDKILHICWWCSEELKIDLDSDGVTDFIIYAGHSDSTHEGSYYEFEFLPKNGNSCAIERVDTAQSSEGPKTFEVVTKQNFGDTINSNLEFTGSSKYIYLDYDNFYNGGSCKIDDWLNAGEKYLAFKFISDNSTYYGWIGVEQTDSDTLVIKDYAFNKAAPLFNKDTYDNDFIMVFPNPTTGFININTNNNDLSKVSIFDISGKLLKTNKFRKRCKFEIEGFRKGMYILKVETNNEILTKRIIIE